MRKSDLVPVPLYVHVTQLLNKIEKNSFFFMATEILDLFSKFCDLISHKSSGSEVAIPASWQTDILKMAG